MLDLYLVDIQLMRTIIINNCDTLFFRFYIFLSFKFLTFDILAPTI